MKQTAQLIAAGMIGGLITLGGSWLLGGSPQTYHIQASQSASSEPNGRLVTNQGNTRNPQDFSEVAQKALPAVVNISAVKEVQARSPQEQQYYDFFGHPRPSESTGSGVVISPKGYIVTNNHVVRGATRVEITLYDKRKFAAQVVGTDPNTDLAVLKIEAPNLTVLEMANSDEALIGEWVLAVGNPFELTSTVTAGIISAKGRNINILGGGRSIESFIQTDAAVNPGNSGGALINGRGELLGINTAIATPTGTYAGYSFAVPINLVKKVVQDLIEHGEVRRASLGVMIQEITGELATKLNLPTTEGIYINEVLANSAALDAGVTAGDVVTKVNGVRVKSVPELQEQIGSRNPGDNVLITVLRNSKEKELVVKLKN